MATVAAAAAFSVIVTADARRNRKSPRNLKSSPNRSRNPNSKLKSSSSISTSIPTVATSLTRLPLLDSPPSDEEIARKASNFSPFDEADDDDDEELEDEYFVFKPDHGLDEEEDDEEEVEMFLDRAEEEEEEEGEGEEVKGKGIPAVMRCFDTARIFVRSGDGGNGVVAFRREKFVPYGGPSGGDGGRGGNVYVQVDGTMNSLLPFRRSLHFRATRGRHGQGSKLDGAKGKDVVVMVPPGTVVKRAEGGALGGSNGEVLLELMKDGEKALLLPGGRGGKGNAAFKTGGNKVPKIAEFGEKGVEL